MIGVPLPELEADDTGVEGGLCVNEHGTATVSSDSLNELEIDDSGITLLLDEQGVVSSDDTTDEGVAATWTEDVSALLLPEELLCCC